VELMTAKRAQTAKVRRAVPAAQTLSALKKEVAALRKLVTAKALTLNRVQVRSLEVVDANGDVVASIDDNGVLFCSSALFATGPNAKGVAISGKLRGVRAGTLELGDGSARPSLVARGDLGKGELKLFDSGNRLRVELDGQGNALSVYAANGIAITTVGNTGAGAVTVYDTAGAPTGALP